MKPKGTSLDESLVSDGSKWSQLSFKGTKEVPNGEWLLHKLHADFNEWDRLWRWEFGREKYREDEAFRDGLKKARQTKKVEQDKIEAFSDNTKRLQELELAALQRYPSTLEVLFPYYVEEWPERPYLSIDPEKRSEFREVEGESGNQYPEMSLPVAGGQKHAIHIDPSWPASVAKKKFAEWYEYVGGGQDAQSSHGWLRRVRGDLKALGAVRLKRLLGEGATWGDVLDHASGCDSPLYQDTERCSEALCRVNGVLEKWFSRPTL